MEACANCRHFLINPDDAGSADQLGWCRRYPPVRRVFQRIQLDAVTTLPVHDVYGREVMADVEESSFPPVQSSFWCGEWLSLDRKLTQDLNRPSAIYSFKPAAAKQEDS